MQMHGHTMTMKEMESSLEMMSRLRGASGPAFDATFLDLFSKHHQDAIDMSKDAQGDARHDEVKAFARKTIDKQTKDIAEMSEMKRQVRSAGR
jgi:uncharacterized protein (DUF305 family)